MKRIEMDPQSNRDPLLVSVIVPVFNGARFLAEALDSILAQTYAPIEIIVVDDGSRDKTPGVVSSYGDKVRYLRQENAGPASARNRGLIASKGLFVAFLDHDDLWHPEKLARQMKRFEDRSELEICVTYAQNFWIPELAEEAEKLKNHPHSKPLPGYIASTLLAKYTTFKKIGLFNSALKHTDTTDWFWRARESGTSMEMLQDLLVFRRIHKKNLSRAFVSESHDEFLRFIKASLDKRRQKETRAK
jgi:glycosyltransferase involved in cell wall biosynthesis